MIVVDANLLAYLVLPGERSGEAEAVLAKDPTWVVPPLWRSELRSVVHKYVLRGDLSVARAITLLEHAADVIDGREGEVDSRDVLELRIVFEVYDLRLRVRRAGQHPGCSIDNHGPRRTAGIS